MGMYTDFCFDATIRSDVPANVVTVLYQMRDFDHNESLEKILPDHPFFRCDRWMQIGHCSSGYFPAEPRFIFEKNSFGNDYVLNIRCNLKNYDDEIKHFIDWIKPYVDAGPGEFLGFYRYEESVHPTLVYM